MYKTLLSLVTALSFSLPVLAAPPDDFAGKPAPAAPRKATAHKKSKSAKKHVQAPGAKSKNVAAHQARTGKTKGNALSHGKGRNSTIKRANSRRHNRTVSTHKARDNHNANAGRVYAEGRFPTRPTR